jgi:hypothetical protein
MRTYLLFMLIINVVWANTDGPCCRKRIKCFECDSRYDPNCADQFSLSRDNGTMIYCDDLCIKLKHKLGSQFHYIRSCADQFKKIYIKKTNVCYSNRAKDGGYLCFCDQDECNDANSLNKLNITYLLNLIMTISLSILLL